MSRDHSATGRHSWLGPKCRNPPLSTEVPLPPLHTHADSFLPVYAEESEKIYLPRRFESESHKRFAGELAGAVFSHQGHCLAETVRGCILDYGDLTGSYIDHVAARAGWTERYLRALKRYGTHNFAQQDFDEAQIEINNIILQYASPPRGIIFVLQPTNGHRKSGDVR